MWVKMMSKASYNLLVLTGALEQVGEDVAVALTPYTGKSGAGHGTVSDRNTSG